MKKIILVICCSLTNGLIAAPPGGPWITGVDLTEPTTGLARPALNTSFTGDVYGAKVRRISEPTTNGDSFVRHEYSRRPAFNSDNSRLIMNASNGFWHLYDVAANDNVTHNHIVPSPMSEPNWHPTNPDIYRYFPYNGGMSIEQYDVVNKTTTTVADFAGRLPWASTARVWTVNEGRPSADGKIWCLMAQDNSFNTLGIFSYDMDTNQILGSLTLTEDPDHISTSVNGQYCVPSSDGNMGTRAYALDFSSFTQLHNKSEHSDVALDANGNDVLVVQDYNSLDHGGWLKMVDMGTGIITRLINNYAVATSSYAVHISGVNFKRPGYIVLSTYAASMDYGSTPADYGDTWGHDRLAIVELKENPVVYNIAYMHNALDSVSELGYFTEPQAVSNSDLSKILFVSTWETPDYNQLATYMVSLDGIFADGFEGGQ